MASGSCGAIVHSFNGSVTTTGLCHAIVSLLMPFLAGTHATMSINACAKDSHNNNMTDAFGQCHCGVMWLNSHIVSLMPSVEASHDGNDDVDAIQRAYTTVLIDQSIDPCCLGLSQRQQRCLKNELQQHSVCAPLLVTNGGLPTSSSFVVD